MILKDQEVRVWGQTPCSKKESINWIEAAGRTCYRSEDKIIDGSGIKFVKNIWKRNHYSVLEHSNIVLRTRIKSKFPNMALIKEKSVFDSKYFSFCIHHDHVYISGNWRSWIEFYKALRGNDDIMTIDNIIDFLESETYEVIKDNQCVPNQLKAITVEFITDRAVTHELVRHRPASYSQESQRYVRYGDITFIKPSWFDKIEDGSYERVIFNNSCKSIETQYKGLLAIGMKAEDARVILPNCTATKIIMTASIPEWKHVFFLRTSKAAYPQIRNIMIPVQEIFNINKWI